MASQDERADGSATLVFGATNAVGRYLLMELPTSAVAISRQPRRHASRHRWIQSDFASFEPDSCPEVIYNCGALDELVRWLERRQCRPAKVVALSSLSVHWKLTSPSPAERALARTLLEAEQALERYCAQHHVRCSVIRASLIWGAGCDRSLTPLAHWAQRWRVLPVPTVSGGNRAPLHAADLARAMIALAAARQHGSSTRLELHEFEGAERLPVRTLLQRIARSVQAFPLPLPSAGIRSALRLGRWLGVASGEAAWRRYGSDQLAQVPRALVQARGFAPIAKDWESSPLP